MLPSLSPSVDFVRSLTSPLEAALCREAVDFVGLFEAIEGFSVCARGRVLVAAAAAVDFTCSTPVDLVRAASLCCKGADIVDLTEAVEGSP